MKFQMKLLNIKNEFMKLAGARKELSSRQAAVVVGVLKEDLVQNTPIDTGFARESWKVNKTDVGHNVTNTAEYIERLNQGSSKQAPAHFIESVALKYGRPEGTIVDIER